MAAPVLSGFRTNLAYTENGAPALIDSDVTLTDAEGNWNGGTIVVSGLSADDVIQVLAEGMGVGQINVSGNLLLIGVNFGGSTVFVPFGTFARTATEFTISFSSAATTAAVERVLERLAYSTTDDTPAATARFTVTVRDAAGEVAIGAGFTERPAAIDPFASIDAGFTENGVLADWDGDGDADLIVGAYRSSLWRIEYYRNNDDGTFTQLTGAANPFGGLPEHFTPSPAIGDVNGDGDLDLVIGESNGVFRTWLRGPGGGLTEAAGAANPFNGFDVGNFASAALVDIDGDTDLDLVAGATAGTFATYRKNVGLSFTELTGVNNPLNGIDVGGYSEAGFGDVDGDGDLDLIAGNGDGNLFYYRRDPSGFVAQTGAANPFNGVDVGGFAAPTFGDVDGDGDIDMLVGAEFDAFTWFERNGGMVTVAITATDDPRTAVADNGGSVAENSSIGGINVLVNDTDPDGGPAAVVTHVNGTAISTGGFVTLASGARVTLNGNGTLQYNPNGAFSDLSGASGAANSSEADSFTYTLTGGSTATVSVTVTGVATAGDRTLGSAGADTITGTSIADLFMLGGGGSDAATGGAGDDGFYLGTALDASDSLTGGSDAGTWDRVGIQGNYASYTFGANNLLGIEELVLLSGSVSAYGDAANNRYSFQLTTVDANVAAGQTLVVNGNTLLATEWVNFNGAAETNGAFRFNLGQGDDTAIGGAGNDIFNMLGGRDFMTGNGGNDVFVFHALTDSSPDSSADGITDFTAGDRINLAMLDANAGTGGDQAFAFIGSAAFSAAGQLRVTGSGTSWLVEVDVNGDGTADFGVSVTTTASGYGWSAADFVL